MGNTLSSFIDQFPPVVHVDPPPDVETKTVDLFEQALEDANRNATAGVVNEVAQAAADADDEMKAILANIVNQQCGGDVVCSNMELIMGDCLPGEESQCSETYGDRVWSDECEKKVSYFARGRRRYGLRSGSRQDNEASRRRCEDGNTMCKWNSSESSNGTFTGQCEKKLCSVQTINGVTTGSACGIQGRTKQLYDKGLRRVCWGVDSETTRGCTDGDLSDPLAPTVDRGCMRFEEKKGEECDVPIKDNQNPKDPKYMQDRALLRQCMDMVAKDKPVATWSGLEEEKEELARLDKLLYASTVEGSAAKCVDHPVSECASRPECAIVGGSCVAKQVDADARMNECSRMRSITNCQGQFCKWDGALDSCVPDKELVSQRRNQLKKEMAIRMEQNTKDFCTKRMCAGSRGGFKSKCIRYFDDAGNIQECPEGYSDRPTDVNGRRYEAPDCSQARAACRAEIEDDLSSVVEKEIIDGISETRHTGINRGISPAECGRKGCAWMPSSVPEPRRSAIRCFEKGTDQACSNCLIRNVEQENTRRAESSNASKSVVDNRIQEVDLVNIQESLRNVAAQATGGFNLRKMEQVQNIAKQCMKASTEIENKVKQECLGGGDDVEGSLLLNIINQQCQNVDAGCEISDIKQSTDLKTTESCLQQVQISNEVLQSMRKEIGSVGLKGSEPFKDKALKMVVWSSVIFGGIAAIMVWLGAGVTMGFVPIIIGALIVFIAGMSLTRASGTDDAFSYDQYLAYASVRRSDQQDEPFGCGVKPFETFSNVSLKEAGEICESIRCKAYYWEANDERAQREPEEYDASQECNALNYPCCPSYCTDSNSGFCESSKCCPDGYEKEVQRLGRYSRVKCVKCRTKRGTVYMYDEDVSETRPECMEGLHQPEKIDRNDLICLTNVDTWAVFAKTVDPSGIAEQGKALAKKAVTYGIVAMAALYIFDIAMRKGIEKSLEVATPAAAPTT